MSASYMTKLMARVSRHKKIDYTAQELALTLNVTIRSANRILLKWMDAELVDIVGRREIGTQRKTTPYLSTKLYRGRAKITSTFIRRFSKYKR